MLLRNALLVLGLLTLIAGAVLAVVWIRLPTISAPGLTSSANQTSAVLVAATDIPQGTLLRSGDMEWKTVAQDAIASGDLVRGQVSEASFYGAVARRHFAMGEKLTASGLLRASERNFLAAVLAPGMQALSLSVDASQSVSGLIQPGDHIDAILAQSVGENTNNASAVGETVLRDVRVVAVDQSFGTDDKPQGEPRTGNLDARTPKTVTLELSDVDAKRLLVATQLGRVTLVLRALQGTPEASFTLSGPEPVWASDISAARGNTHAVKSAKAPIRTATDGSVQIMRGAKTETH